MERDCPGTIYSYNANTSLLHWTNVASDRSETVEVPNHKFADKSDWVLLGNGDLFFSGGMSGPGSYQGSTLCYVLDTRELSVTLKPSMSTARYSHGSLYFEGRVYVVGGCHTSALSDCESFECDGETWTTLQRMPQASYLSSLTELIHKRSILVIGGCDSNSDHQLNIQEYTVDSDEWRVWPIKLEYPDSSIHSFKLSRESSDVYIVGAPRLSKLDTTTQELSLIHSDLDPAFFHYLKGPCFYYNSTLFVASSTCGVVVIEVGEIA